MVKMDFKDVESYLEKKKKELGLDIQILKLQKDIGDDEEIIKANQGMTNFDTIFVSGLPENCGDVMVRKEFENFGPVKDIRMPVHQDTGKSKRIAFVTFKDQAHARNAVRNPEILIQG
jgi:RNA recognition motif-containing protein